MSQDSRASIRSMGRLEVEGWRHGDLIGRWQGMMIGLAGDLDVALRAATTKVPPTAAKASLVQQTRRHPHPPLNKCDGQGGRQIGVMLAVFGYSLCSFMYIVFYSLVSTHLVFLHIASSGKQPLVSCCEYPNKILQATEIPVVVLCTRKYLQLVYSCKKFPRCQTGP